MNIVLASKASAFLVFWILDSVAEIFYTQSSNVKGLDKRVSNYDL